MNNKKLWAVVCLLLIAVSASHAARKPQATGTQTALENFAKLPLAFEANQGQSDPRTRFLARGRGYGLFLSASDAVLSLHALGDDFKNPVRLRMQLLNSNLTPSITGEEELPGKVNYLISPDPKQWITNVRTYSKVRYRGVYPGVDMVYYGRQGTLEYDFVLAPGANPDRIRMRISGGERLSITPEGDLLVNLADREVRLLKPVVYQEVKGERELVAGDYRISNDEISFAIGKYDRNRSLVIDPAVVYSTYLGGSVSGDPFREEDPPPGSAFNGANDVAVDSNGNAYITGTSDATDFPTTAGAYDRSQAAGGCNPHGGGCHSGFVSKINSNGTALIYSTFFGSGPSMSGIAVDANGRAYVAGRTSAPGGIPTTANAYQHKCDCEFSDDYAFLTVFNSSGSGLVYSTYFGSPTDQGGTRAWDVAVGTSGVAYITGETGAPDLPVTSSAYQSTHGGGWRDAFVAKIDPSRSGAASLQYSTYLGGSEFDAAHGIATSGGRVYLTGTTHSANFPTTAGAFDRVFNPGNNPDMDNNDAFVAKIDTNLRGAASLAYSTYLGGTLGERGEDIAHLSGFAYVTGVTTSSDFPTTPGAFDRSYGGGTCGSRPEFPCTDMFVTKVNTNGSGLVYSTYLGGQSDDPAGAIAVQTNGNATVVGTSFSLNYPVTSDAVQKNRTVASADAVLTTFNASGSGLAYSTYFGGSVSESGNGIAAGPGGSVYMAGQTRSTDFPTSSPTVQRTRKGMIDAFLVKFTASNCSAPQTSGNVNICAPQSGASVNSPVRISAAAKLTSPKFIQVYVDGSKKYQTPGDRVEFSLSMSRGTRRVTVQAQDKSGQIAKKTVFVTVR